MFVITKSQKCPMCGVLISSSASNLKKQRATELALEKLSYFMFTHWRKGDKCKDEFKLYDENLKEYLRPKFITASLRLYKNIVGYING
jgi:hypothetical protein